MIGHPIQQPQSRFALINGRVILPQTIVTGQAIVVEGQKIAGLCEVDSLGAEVEKIDVGGRYITPGLIDIHIHGAVGHTFNEPAAEAFAAITRETAKRGVTSLLATISTAPLPNLEQCLQFSQRWMAETHQATQLLGVHLEGPYFCLAQSGAQDPANIRHPDDGTPDRLLEYHNAIKIMTYAPELPGGLELTSRLAKLGIVPAAGHSSAKDKDVLAAMEAGLRHIIHICICLRWLWRNLAC